MIAIIVCIFIVVLDAIQDYVLFRIGYDHLSVFEKWIGVRYFSYGSIVWNFLFPIIVSIPYATSLRNEMKTRYSLMIVTVIGKRKYFFVKSMIACLSGFIISAITLILDFMILSCYNPAYYPLIDSMTTSILQNDMLSSYFYSSPFCYCAIWFCIISFWAANFSLFTMAISLIIKKETIALITSEIIFIIQAIVSDFAPIKINTLTIETSWMGLLYADSLALSPWYTIFLNQIILLVFSTIIICKVERNWDYV